MCSLSLPAFIGLTFALALSTTAVPQLYSDQPAHPPTHQAPDQLSTRIRTSSRCTYEFRTLNGKCTNHRFPLWGSTGRPIASLFRFRSSTTPSGRNLPSARFISNTVSTQQGNILNSRGLNELVTFFGQIIDHTCVFTPPGTERMDIPIPPDDPIFSNFTGGVLHFTRSTRATLDQRRWPHRRRNHHRGERPVNELPAAMDLVSVYGAEEERASELRTHIDGKLKTSRGQLLPLNTAGLPNAPVRSAAFFLAGDERANENPVLTALHTLFVREHNSICDELKAHFPDYDDEKLYENARKINIAQFQKIVYEEYFPAMTGTTLRRYRGFQSGTDVSVLDEFSTAAFRVGHTLVGNVVNRQGSGNTPLPSLPMDKMFFRPSSLLASSGIDEFLRGAAHFEAQEVDLKVHDSIRNFLFTGIPGEDAGFDLIALNLQRGRDHGLRSYNDLRRRFGMPVATSFADITRNVNVQTALSTAYGGDVTKVEQWVGMMAEDHVRGSSFGPTLLKVWEKQFTRFRDGDRFFYLNNIFSRELRMAIPRIDALRTEREIFRAMIIRNTRITSDELPSSIFFK